MRHPPCACGRPRNHRKPRCSQCEEKEVRRLANIKAAAVARAARLGRMRCQAKVKDLDCVYPPLPGKRWCRAHEPVFDGVRSLEDYASARKEVIPC